MIKQQLNLIYKDGDFQDTYIGNFDSIEEIEEYLESYTIKGYEIEYYVIEVEY